MENEIYFYETKCRLYGGFAEWYFAHVSQIDVFTFQQAMQDHVDHARIHACKPCGKDTVADVVSYGKKSR